MTKIRVRPEERLGRADGWLGRAGPLTALACRWPGWVAAVTECWLGRANILLGRARLLGSFPCRLQMRITSSSELRFRPVRYRWKALSVYYKLPKFETYRSYIEGVMAQSVKARAFPT